MLSGKFGWLRFGKTFFGIWKRFLHKSKKRKLERVIRSTLVAIGFKNEGMGRWRKTRGEDWIDLVHVRVIILDDTLIVEADLGLFSKQIDKVCGWSKLAGFDDYEHLPQTPSLCHFFSVVFDLDAKGNWVQRELGDLRLAVEEINNETCQRLSGMLRDNITGAIGRYGSIEAVADCYDSRTGGTAGGKIHTMFAATAMILLGRQERVPKMLENLMRAGTVDFEKTIHANVLKAARR